MYPAALYKVHIYIQSTCTNECVHYINRINYKFNLPKRNWAVDLLQTV